MTNRPRWIYAQQHVTPQSPILQKSYKIAILIYVLEKNPEFCPVMRPYFGVSRELYRKVDSNSYFPAFFKFSLQNRIGRPFLLGVYTDQVADKSGANLFHQDFCNLNEFESALL
jgi:hypothetical protein